MGAPHSPLRPQLGAPLFDSRLFTSLPFRRCSAWMGCFTRYVVLDPRQRLLAWICAPPFDSGLLHRHQHFPCLASTTHHALLLSLWCTSLPTEFIILPLKLHSDSLLANHNSNLLDITNRAK
jgi:hypothetical protein